jgi:hypothetical protein
MWMVTLSLPLLGGGCDLFAYSATIRYRMTVQVATPQGLRTDSSVIQSTISMTRTIYDPHALDYKVKGEAVAVDLPGGTLFAVLNNRAIGSDYPTYLLHNALTHGIVSPPLSRHYDAPEWMEETAEANQVKPTIVLQPVDYPTLVRFRDPREATSMEVVDPEDLSVSFGPGAYLHRITLQITDDSVTDGILAQIPDMGSKTRFLSWQLNLPQDDARRHLTLDSFSRIVR